MRDAIEGGLMGFICALAVLAAVWVVAGSFVASGVAERCDNYGGFVYQDVRYTCEKVVK